MEYLFIALAGFLAFSIKGLIGTGSTTVLVALCSFIIDPKLSIVLSSLVNIPGGLAMLRVDPIPLAPRYWAWVAVIMIVGSVFGAIALKVVPSDVFQILLGITFLFSAIWFVTRVRTPEHLGQSPTQADAYDLITGVFSGFCGGFVGVNAPPLVLHFSRRLDKRHLRRFMVLVFIPAAIAQSLTFTLNGMLTVQILMWGVAIVPSIILGVYFGNKSFHNISEVWFRRVLALFLIIVSVRMIIKGSV